MTVQTFVVGVFYTNCYIVVCDRTKEAIAIDPGFNSSSEAKKTFKFIQDSALTLRFIVNTHGHPDHTSGNDAMQSKFNAPILIHKDDAYMLRDFDSGFNQPSDLAGSSSHVDRLLTDGEIIRFGQITFEVVHTPGHTPGGISLLGSREVFTGDTLFAGSIGRTDFPESSRERMKKSLQKLAKMPESLTAYPGHGPATTIAEEKRNNPFLQ